MAILGQDKELFLREIRPAHLNLAGLLSQVSIAQPWRDIPYSAIVEGLNKLQPRYYSISSSSLAQPNEVSITAIVESKPLQDQGRVFKGVATNFLLALKYAQTCEVPPESFKLSYQLHGPRNARRGMKLPIHIRPSLFKLPADPKRPIIMVGPGTGVAPFRGFVQERARNADQGREVGETLLFFGCRKASEDLIYAAEWEVSWTKAKAVSTSLRS